MSVWVCLFLDRLKGGPKLNNKMTEHFDVGVYI